MRFHAHANGFVQVPLMDGTRLHIFSDAVPRPATTGLVHDHKFRFESTVLVGQLVHAVCVLEPSPNGSHRMWIEVERGRLEREDLYNIHAFGCELEHKGFSYEFGGPGRFHQVVAVGEAATLVRILDRQPEHKQRMLCHRWCNPSPTPQFPEERVLELIDELDLWRTIFEHGGPEG